MGFASGKLGGVAPPVAAPPMRTPTAPGLNPYDNRRPSSEGLGGFGVNAVRDLRDFVSGMATMGGSLISDVGKATAEGLTLGQFESGGYSDFSKGVLHDLVKAGAEAATLGTIQTGGTALDIGDIGEGYGMAPAIAADYASRYGSFGGFLRGLYEHPLAFASDVATVATMGSYGAARTASALSRIPRIAEEVALLADNPLAEVSRAARFVSKVQGKPIPMLTAEGAVDLIPQAYSPIRRIYQRGLNKVLTRPIEAMDNEIVGLRSALEEAGAAERPGIQAQLTQLERLRSIAREGGIERTLRPRVEKYQLRKIADNLIGTTGSRFIHEREALTREFGEILAQIPEELTPEAAVHALQLLDTSMLIDEPAVAARVATATQRTAQRAVEAGTSTPGMVEALRIAVQNLDEINDTIGEVAPVGERLADLGAERAWIQSEVDRIANRRVGSQATVRRVGPTTRFDPTRTRIGGYRDYRTMLERRLSQTEREIGRLGEIHGVQEAQRQLGVVGQRMPESVVTPSEYRAALRALADLSPRDFDAAARLAFEGRPPMSYEDLMFRVRHAETDTPWLDSIPDTELPTYRVRDPVGRDLGSFEIRQSAQGSMAQIHATEGFGPGVLGPRGVKSTLRELHLRHPDVREWQIASREGRPMVRLRVTPDRLRPPDVRRLIAPDVEIGLSTMEDYVAARANMGNEWQPFVTLFSPRELAERGARPYLTADHQAGYFLDPDGQIAGVFATPQAEPGVGKALMVHAIQNGGTYVFHFDGFLTDYYARFGFRPFASLPWNPDYAPANWNYERFGTPRVTWMRYEGGPRESIAERYATFSDVPPLASVPRTGSPQGTLGGPLAERPRPGVVEGEPGAPGPGVADDLASRPVAESFLELSAPDQQAAIVNAGYPETELGESLMDVVREDLELWDQQLYMAPDVVERVDRLVDEIWDRHPSANQPLPDTLFDPDPYRSNLATENFPEHPYEPFTGYPPEQPQLPLERDPSGVALDLPGAEQTFWRAAEGTQHPGYAMAEEARETWSGPDTRRNQWGMEIPDPDDWEFIYDDYTGGWRINDQGGRYEGYANTEYDGQGTLTIHEMGIGIQGRGVSLSDSRMNGLVDRGLQRWFYEELQPKYPGIFRIEFSTVDSAASINRAWSRLIDQLEQTGSLSYGYASYMPYMHVLTSFTPEQLRHIPFGRLVDQMSLEERQLLARAIQSQSAQGRHIVREIPDHRLTAEGAQNKAAFGSQGTGAGNATPIMPLEGLYGRGAMRGGNGVFIGGEFEGSGTGLYVVPDPTGAARQHLIDQRTFAALRDDIPAIRDGEAGRALYPRHGTPLPDTWDDALPLQSLSDEQRQLIVKYLDQMIGNAESRYYTALDEYDPDTSAYEPDDPFSGYLEEIRDEVRGIAEGIDEPSDWMDQTFGSTGYDRLGALWNAIPTDTANVRGLVYLIGSMEPTDLLVEIRGQGAQMFNISEPTTAQAMRDAGAELLTVGNYMSPQMAIVSPHAIARVNGDWTGRALQEEAFNTRVANAGYLQFGEDAPNRAAVEITRAASGAEMTPEELARVQALEPEDAWRIINERTNEPAGGAAMTDVMDRYRLGTGQQHEDVTWMVVDPESDGARLADHTALRRNQAFTDSELHVELPQSDVLENPQPEYGYVHGEQPYWDQSVAPTVEDAQAMADSYRDVLMPQLSQIFGPEGVRWRSKGLQEIESSASRQPAGQAMVGWQGVRDIAGVRIIDPDVLRDPIGVLERAINGLDPRLTNGVAPRVWAAEQSLNVPERDGTRAITVTLQMPGGGPVELQLMTPLMHQADEATWRTRVWMQEKIREFALRQNDYEAIPLEEWEAVEKAGRYSQGMWEAVTDEIREAGLGVKVPQMRKVMNNLRLQVGAKLADPMIEQGYTPDLAFDAQYLPLRLSRGARWDKDTGDFVGGPSTLQLDSEIGGDGLPQPVYYPKYDARTPRKFSDWLLPRRTQGMRARTNRPGFEMKNTGYLTANDLYVKDPFEAYARRAALAIRKREALYLVEAVTRRFGHRIREGDILAPNEVVFAPDFLKRFYKMRVKVDDEVMRRVAERLQKAGYEGEALSMDEGMWDLVKNVIVESQDEAVGLTSRGVELWAIPKLVGDRLDASMRPLLGSSARLFWDTPTNLWRNMALAGSPRWIVNNLFGNILFLKMQGGKLSDVIRQLSPRFREAVRGTIGEEALSKVEGGLFGTVGAYNTKLGRAGQTATGQFFESVSKTPVARGFRKFGDFMRGLNSEVENAFRRASYITAAERTSIKAGLKRSARSFWTSRTSLNQIFDIGMDPKLFDKAVNEVNYFFNDYAAMSPFGRQVMRRFLVPFWGFYRHVTHLLLTFPIEHPVRFAVMRQLAQVGNEIEEDYSGGLPEWARGFVPIGPGANPNETRFMSTRGPDPFSAVFQSPLSLIHPLIKAGWEYASGRSTLSGREFTDPDVASAFGSDAQYRISAKPGGGYTAERVETVRPSVWEMLAQQIPQYDLLKDAIAGGRTYDTSSLLDVIANREGQVRTDPDTGEPYTPFSPLDALSRSFGFTTYDINLTEEQLRELEEQRAAILAVLRQQGYVPPDESVAGAASSGGGGGFAASKLGG
jgi:hypothetical protein